MQADISTGLMALLALCLAGPLYAQETGKGGQGAAVDAAIDAAALPLCSVAPTAGETVLCRCPEGAPAGSAWGSGPYTADSDICTAARHAGVVTEGGGAVQVAHRSGQDSYAGSARNGVSTRDWGAYGESFDILPAAAPVPVGDAAPGTAACSVLPAGTDLLTCTCASGVSGPVRGSGPYTADSNICSAARHAGVIGAEGGAVTVLRVPGLEGYSGSSANGETSAGWAAYDSSIVFDLN